MVECGARTSGDALARRPWAGDGARPRRKAQEAQAVSQDEIRRIERAIANRIWGAPPRLTTAELDFLCEVTDASFAYVADGLRIDRSTVTRRRRAAWPACESGTASCSSRSTKSRWTSSRASPAIGEGKPANAEVVFVAKGYDPDPTPEGPGHRPRLEPELAPGAVGGALTPVAELLLGLTADAAVVGHPVAPAA